MKYANDTDTLIISDLERVRNEKEPISVDDGQFMALVLEFSLPSSSYATMALREILKADTSVASQVHLHESVNLKRSAASEDEGDDADEKKKTKIENEE